MATSIMVLVCDWKKNVDMVMGGGHKGRSNLQVPFQITLCTKRPVKSRKNWSIYRPLCIFSIYLVAHTILNDHIGNLKVYLVLYVYIKHLHLTRFIYKFLFLI